MKNRISAKEKIEDLTSLISQLQEEDAYQRMRERVAGSPDPSDSEDDSEEEEGEEEEEDAIDQTEEQEGGAVRGASRTTTSTTSQSSTQLRSAGQSGNSRRPPPPIDATYKGASTSKPGPRERNALRSSGDHATWNSAGGQTPRTSSTALRKTHEWTDLGPSAPSQTPTLRREDTTLLSTSTLNELDAQEASTSSSPTTQEPSSNTGEALMKLGDAALSTEITTRTPMSEFITGIVELVRQEVSTTSSELIKSIRRMEHNGGMGTTGRSASSSTTSWGGRGPYNRSNYSASSTGTRYGYRSRGATPYSRRRQ